MISINEMIAVGSVVDGYSNHPSDGVVGLGGNLNIRPKYQRNYVYDKQRRAAVIDTIMKKGPLGEMFWCSNDDETFEVMDGQQRIISICEYVRSAFSIDGMYFHNLPQNKQDQINNYQLNVWTCKGEPSELIDWFKIINIPGMPLTNQEIRNSVYTGTWLDSAKEYFSKPNCPAVGIGGDYLYGKIDRQDYLETALKWISDGDIEEYMGSHQHHTNADELWAYFDSVIRWVKETFPNYRSEMKKNINYGILYDRFKDDVFDADALEEEISTLMQDENVTKKSGIYPYVLTRLERYLNIRVFSKKQMREAYEQQEGICIKCGNEFELEEMQGDHRIPWVEGGKTISSNCQMLCIDCNRKKGAR